MVSPGFTAGKEWVDNEKGEVRGNSTMVVGEIEAPAEHTLHAVHCVKILSTRKLSYLCMGALLLFPATFPEFLMGFCYD